MSRSIRLPLAALLGLACVAPAAHSAIVVTEIDARGSAAGYGDDWIELTNTGASGVNVNGYKVNDDTDGLGGAVSIAGIGTLAAGQSAILFLEVAAGELSGKISSFSSAWFNNTTPPAGLVFGYADGSGLGLGNGGDAVNLWDTSNALIASLTFGATDANATFENPTLKSSGSISTISQVGINGAFASLSTSNNEIGSPGVAPVPLPAAAWLLLSGAGMLAPVMRRRRQKNA